VTVLLYSSKPQACPAICCLWWRGSILTRYRKGPLQCMSALCRLVVRYVRHQGHRHHLFDSYEWDRCAGTLVQFFSSNCLGIYVFLLQGVSLTKEQWLHYLSIYLFLIQLQCELGQCLDLMLYEAIYKLRKLPELCIYTMACNWHKNVYIWYSFIIYLLCLDGWQSEFEMLLLCNFNFMTVLTLRKIYFCDGLNIFFMMVCSHEITWWRWALTK
jgi:hypothetical protein